MANGQNGIENGASALEGQLQKPSMSSPANEQSPSAVEKRSLPQRHSLVAVNDSGVYQSGSVTLARAKMSAGAVTEAIF